MKATLSKKIKSLLILVFLINIISPFAFAFEKNTTLTNGPLNLPEREKLKESFHGLKTYIETYKTRIEGKFLNFKKNHTDSFICRGCQGVLGFTTTFMT
jgi:hypothetical protein